MSAASLQGALQCITSLMLWENQGYSGTFKRKKEKVNYGILWLLNSWTSSSWRPMSNTLIKLRCFKTKKHYFYTKDSDSELASLCQVCKILQRSVVVIGSLQCKSVFLKQHPGHGHSYRNQGAGSVDWGSNCCFRIQHADGQTMNWITANSWPWTWGWKLLKS